MLCESVAKELRGLRKVATIPLFSGERFEETRSHQTQRSTYSATARGGLRTKKKTVRVARPRTPFGTCCAAAVLNSGYLETNNFSVITQGNWRGGIVP